MLTNERLERIREDLRGIKERANYEVDETGYPIHPGVCANYEYDKRGRFMVRDMDLLLAHIDALQQTLSSLRATRTPAEHRALLASLDFYLETRLPGHTAAAPYRGGRL